MNKRGTVGEARTTRSKEDESDVICDAVFYFKASQSHVRPQRPQVAELIEKELRLGVYLIAHMRSASLLVGLGGIEATEHEDTGSDIMLEAGVEAAIKGVQTDEVTGEKSIALFTADRPELLISPTTLARTLVNGGVIFAV